MYLTSAELKSFDSELYRKAAVLENLTEGAWQTAASLGRLLNLDTRSISRLLHELEKDYRQFTRSDLPLFDKDKGNGLRLLFADNELEQEQFLIYLIRHTASFRLTEAIVNGELHSLTAFSRAFFISETTAYRKLTEQKKHLAQYGLSLKRGSYQLKGCETAIRMYLSIYYWRLFRGKVWPFPYIQRQMAQDIAEKIMAFFRVDFHAMKKLRLEYLIAASLLREAQHHECPDSRSFAVYLTDNPLFEAFCRKLAPAFPQYHQSRAALGYLFLALLTREEYYQQPEISEAITAFHREKLTPVFQSQQRLEELLLEDLRPEDQRLGAELLQRAHSYLLSGQLFATLFPDLEVNINAKPFWTRTLAQRTELVEWLKEKFALLAAEYGQEIYAPDNMLFRRYLTVLKELAEFLPQLPRLKILLLTDLPLFEEEVLMNDLRHFFKRNYRLEFYRQPEEAACDLCLTTSYLLWPLESGLKTLLITQELKIEDYLELAQLFEKVLR